MIIISGLRGILRGLNLPRHIGKGYSCDLVRIVHDRVRRLPLLILSVPGRDVYHSGHLRELLHAELACAAYADRGLSLSVLGHPSAVDVIIL